VYFEMPQTQRAHKSMLLRGVKLPAPALTSSDIEVIRGKISRGPRGPGYNRDSAVGFGRRREHNDDRGWYPPPPGAPGFGIGVPPPPPSGT
ncbi:hypothetical protein E4U53_005344, partial [Claviceps sorghi]